MSGPTSITVRPPAGRVGATQGPYTVAGDWVLSANSPLSGWVDVTWFRGVPSDLGSWSFSDPFGPKSATFTFPGITIFDRIGEGDLSWCRKDAGIDLYWDGALPAHYPYPIYRWEGYMESFRYTSKGLTVECKGALYQLDNYLAKPEYLSRPLPYEYAIARQFDDVSKPDLLLPRPIMTYPNFAPVYDQPAKTPYYLIPTGVNQGKQWTGLVTRSTGSWEPVLTSYIQTLLSSMYTAYGRYTLDLNPYRQPQMFHRNYALTVVQGQTCVIDVATPGVEVDINQDFSQTMNRVYGQAKSASGLEYSGQEIYDDPVYGTVTRYEPLAELRQVHNGYGKKSAWNDTTVFVREQMLQLQDGLDADQARDAGTAHLARFTDPGLIGTVTLRVDPQFVTSVGYTNGIASIVATATMPRQLIRPGMTLLLPGIFANPDGVLVHITEVVCNGSDGSVVLTVDSKNRDAMTVREVKARGRDAMSIQRQIIGGAYSPPVSDQLVPWNYAAGSGYIPSAPKQNAVHLFKGMPASITFPWTEWTTLRPPSSKAWRGFYAHIGPKSSIANNNWSGYPTFNVAGGVNYGLYAIPIKMSQAGSVRMVEIAAYDKNGNIMKVPFHVSFYYQRGTSYAAMPQIVAGNSGTDGYASGQHYPFFNQAWEQYNPDGTRITSETPLSVAGAGLIRAYGTRFAPAGYWPGSKAAGDKPTGMLVDEGRWEFDTGSIQDSAVLMPTKKAQGHWAGYLYCMIYCDAQLKQDVYFLGRLYRQEPGQS